MISSPKLILASASNARTMLLNRIGYQPSEIVPADLDETEKPGELPHHLAKRLAKEKAEKIAASFPNDIVIAADTVAAAGRLILPKALSEDDAAFCLGKLSGRRHKVFTGICTIYNSRILVRLGATTVKFKRLSKIEKELYIASKQWQNKAGGYAIQGLAAAFVEWISGSDISNVTGLSVYDTYIMLSTLGLQPNLDLLTKENN